MTRTLIWVLSFSVLGPVPESGELAKYATQEECRAAMAQKRQEYREKKQKIVATCHPSTR